MREASGVMIFCCQSTTTTTNKKTDGDCNHRRPRCHHRYHRYLWCLVYQFGTLGLIIDTPLFLFLNWVGLKYNNADADCVYDFDYDYVGSNPLVV